MSPTTPPDVSCSFVERRRTISGLSSTTTTSIGSSAAPPISSAAARALYGYRHADLNEPHVIELRRARESVARKQGNKFPEWVLDQIGTEVIEFPPRDAELFADLLDD